MEALEDKDSSMEVEELFLDEEDSEIGNGHKPQPAVSHQPTNSLNPATEHSISSEAKYRKISEKTTENSENTKKSRNNSPLLHTRGWDSTRKQTSTLPSTMEEDRHPQLALVRYSGRIQDPIQFNTNPMDDKEIPLIHRRPTSSRQCSRFILELSGNRTFSYAGQQVSLTVLHNKKTEQDPTYFGLQKNQPVCSVQPLQNGRCTCPEGYCGTKRFLDEDRPEGCIHCRTHSSRLPQVSFVLPQRHNLSVQVTGIRPECCTKNILQADEICFRTIENQRNSLGVLSGRHLCAGEDQGGDTSTQPDGLATTDELGILDQLREERSRAETHARVLRLQLQYQNNEDQCPTNKIIEIDHANTTTIEEDNDILLPMDCESPGEDDIDDTSNWRSVTPCEVYSERPCSGTSTTASELGKTLPTVYNELERTQLVVSTSTTSQWTPHHHEERRKDTRHRDLCRRVGHWLGCDISQDRNSRILVTGRKRTVNQREGVENDIVCPPTPCKRVRRFADQSLLRQYHGSEIRKEIRRDSLPISTRTRSSNLRAHSKTQHTSSVSTRTRSKECSSRLLEQKKEAPLRMETTSKVFQNDSSSMGASQTGRLCHKRKHKTTAFLESMLYLSFGEI